MSDDTNDTSTARPRRRRPWEKKFLEALEKTGNISAAARYVGKSHNLPRVYAAQNPEFEQELNDARQRGLDRVAASVQEMALESDHPPTRLKAAMFILQSQRPEEWRRPLDVEQPAVLQIEIVRDGPPGTQSTKD
ncbi:MAG: hypothetical protein OXG72_16610 [Acidobacteria bacterium]|nr:hypothetical protein [Acidobacteriota bacterium]